VLLVVQLQTVFRTQNKKKKKKKQIGINQTPKDHLSTLTVYCTNLVQQKTVLDLSDFGYLFVSTRMAWLGLDIGGKMP
jgi:hypothetical protein